MAKAHYVGVNGVARKVKKQYVGVAGVARNVTKGYVGVNGVARQYFASGVKWGKYSCDYTPRHFTKATSLNLNESKFGTETIKAGNTNHAFALGYYWMSDTLGYGVTEYTEITGADILSTSGNAVVGLYRLPIESHIEQITRVTDISEDADGNVTYTLYSKTVAKGYRVEATYNKGSTFYGNVYAPEGQLPESGTVIKGSLADGYYVLRSGSTYYYYVLVEE